MNNLKEKLIPELRFNEFKGEWNTIELSELVDINCNSGDLPENFYYIDLESVSKGILTDPEYLKKSSAPSRAQRILKQNDVLFQTVRPYQRNNFLFNLSGDYVASTGYALLRYEKSPEYLYQFLHTNTFVNEVSKRSTGTNYPAINTSDLSTIKISVPSKQEQQKIASFLSLIDKKIELLKKKKELLELYKKGVMQKIFNQEIRFKDKNGNDYPEWEEKRLGEILKEYVEKTTKEDQFSILSSAKNGLFLQEEYFNREIASQNNIGYKVLRKNQLVFSPQNLWLGNINFNEQYERGMVSPSYKIFNVNEKEMYPLYFKYIIRLPRMIYKYMTSSEQGASIVRRNLNMDLFKKIKIQVPCKNEQKDIYNFLENISALHVFTRHSLNQISLFKKGLLQKMFI